MAIPVAFWVNTMTLSSDNISDEMASNRVAKALEHRRKELGLTMQEVADRLNMSVGSVHNLMTGNHTYPTAVLERVASALDWTPVHIYMAASDKKAKDSPEMRKIGTILSKANAKARLRRQAQAQPEGG